MSSTIICILVIVAVIIVMYFIISIILGLSTNKETNSISSINGRLVLVGKYHFDDVAIQYILYDPETKVMYSLVTRGYAGGLSVMYNADGTLKKYLS